MSVSIAAHALSGGLAGVVTELTFYSIDSLKVIQQQQQRGEGVSMRRLFKGALPVALSGSFPSFAVFFAVFAPLKALVNDSSDASQEVSVFSSVGILSSSVIAAVPSSLVGVPSDVLKKRIILGIDENVPMAAKNAMKEHGLRGLFLGWQSNLIKDIPFAGLKISLYEYLRMYYLQSFCPSDKTEESPSESAMIGLVAGAITSVLTCPIDCVNTRIKSGELANYSVIAAHREIVLRDGVKALFRGLAPRTFILSLGSSVFWFWYNKILRLFES